VEQLYDQYQSTQGNSTKENVYQAGTVNVKMKAEEKDRETKKEPAENDVKEEVDFKKELGDKG
jgi:hypothetical protein